MTPTPRVIAIDWSGDQRGGKRKIWLASVYEDRVDRLENGRTREETARYVIQLARTAPRLIVGLDFAFSCPAWFVRDQNARNIAEFWVRVSSESATWLHNCISPFWGRPGKKCDHSRSPFRQTELLMTSVGGIRPKSVFQIGGAGAVGTGSMRGMPILKTLSDAGFRIWPFHEPRLPLVVEIYPRVLTGTVNKSDRQARATYLAKNFPDLDRSVAARASSSEDAFDALVSALTMAANLPHLTSLSKAVDPEVLLEGLIWMPPASVGHGSDT